MNANAFRHFYEYHFFENRKIWDGYIVPLSYEQFTQNAAYSHGSVRDQIVHLMNVDEAWFSGLRGVENTSEFIPADFDDRKLMRTHWDGVEQAMRGYLDKLRDEVLFEKPFADGEDKDLILWQVLLHVANHGTDHRAQLLRLLHETSQDYIFHVYDNP